MFNSAEITAVRRGVVWDLWLKYPPLLKLVFPKSNVLHMVVATLFFSALTALAAQLRIPLPDTPVPITLQTMTVLLAGGMLGVFWGSLSMLVYASLGALGMPVFAGANGGWEYMLGATGGYIVGFVLASAAAGYLAQRGLIGVGAVWASVAASIAVYIPGLLWLSRFLPADSVLAKGFYPFVAGDIFKLIGASLLLGIAWTIAQRRQVDRRV